MSFKDMGPMWMWNMAIPRRLAWPFWGSTWGVFGVYMIGGFTSRNDTLPEKTENYMAMNLDIIDIDISYIILV